MLRKVLFLYFLCAAVFSATLNVTPTNPIQGNSVKIVLQTDGVIQDASVLFNKQSFPLYWHSTNKYVTILGTSFNWPTGNYPLRVTYKQNGKAVTKSATVNLRAGKFRVSTLTISNEKQSEGATDFTVLREENRILSAVYRDWKKGSYIDGLFVHPLSNATTNVTSPYGSQRYYKDQAGKQISQWSHRGIDYRAAMGTPVHAAQNGIVVVADKMQVNGNIVVIDHGRGVMSIYSHLDEILVKKGQYVTKNALIARSGNTGLSTGPHLHFGLSVHDIRVNPEEWYTRKWY